MSFNPQVAALEQEYIKLLRKKIAMLEDQVGSDLTIGPKVVRWFRNNDSNSPSLTLCRPENVQSLPWWLSKATLKTM